MYVEEATPAAVRRHILSGIECAVAHVRGQSQHPAIWSIEEAANRQCCRPKFWTRKLQIDPSAIAKTLEAVTGDVRTWPDDDATLQYIASWNVSLDGAFHGDVIRGAIMFGVGRLTAVQDFGHSTALFKPFIFDWLARYTGECCSCGLRPPPKDEKGKRQSQTAAHVVH